MKNEKTEENWTWIFILFCLSLYFDIPAASSCCYSQNQFSIMHFPNFRPDCFHICILDLWTPTKSYKHEIMAQFW